MGGDTSTARRTALTLGGVVAVDLLFAAAIAALLVPWTTPITAALGGLAGVERVPAAVVWLAAVAVVLAVLVAAQLRYVRRRILASVDATPATADAHPDLLARVRRLAALADARVPSVAVVDSTTPNALSVGGVRDATLVVSTGLLDRLDDDQLDAVLAHELAHVRNRDAAVLTLASFLPVLVDDRPTRLPGADANPLAWIAALPVAYVLSAGIIDAPLFSPAYTGVFAALMVALVLFGGAALGALAVPVALLARRLAREREYAADRAGALLTGDPAAMASALSTLDPGGADRPATDAREGQVAALCLLPHGFGGGDGSPTAGDGEAADGFVVETRSHPPTDRRVERLRDLAVELED